MSRRSKYVAKTSCPGQQKYSTVSLSPAGCGCGSNGVVPPVLILSLVVGEEVALVHHGPDVSDMALVAGHQLDCILTVSGAPGHLVGLGLVDRAGAKIPLFFFVKQH